MKADAIILVLLFGAMMNVDALFRGKRGGAPMGECRISILLTACAYLFLCVAVSAA